MIFLLPVERATSAPPVISSVKLQPAGYLNNSTFPELQRYWNTKVWVNHDRSQEEGKSFSEEG